MPRVDFSGLLGVFMFISIIVAATAAYIAYKNPDTGTVILWASAGAIVLFIIGLLFFGGVKLPQPRPGRWIVIVYLPLGPP